MSLFYDLAAGGTAGFVLSLLFVIIFGFSIPLVSKTHVKVATVLRFTLCIGLISGIGAHAVREDWFQ